MKPHLFTIGAFMAALTLPATAQNSLPSANKVPSATTISLTSYLQLQPRQIEALDRLYDGYASRRAPQEERIAQWAGQLRAAQLAAAFDARAATRLGQNINGARQKVVADLVATRAKALEILPPVQRAQLQSLATDSRFQVRGDRYFQLLLLPVEAVGQERLQWEPQRLETRNRGTGGIGVYGGYGYGQPQYGVYGSYGQGPIGIHAGIGRGGPSIGIGIGGIFGGRRR